MNGRLGFVLTLLLATLSMGITGELRADDKKAAKQHFDAGKLLYTAEDFTAAALEFEESVRLYPTKNGFYNLANCYKALHKYRRALDTIVTMRSKLGDKMDDVMAQKVLDLEKTIRMLVGELSIKVSEPSATIFLDGQEIGKSPLIRPIIVGPGKHAIRVIKEGFADAEKHIEILSRTKSLVKIALNVAKAMLTVKVNLPGAQVTVDGSVIGESPLKSALEVTSGTHQVQVSLNGYPTQTKEISLNPADAKTVTIQLAKDTAPKDDAKRQDKSSANTRRISGLTIGFLASTIVVAAGTGAFYGMGSYYNGEKERYNSNYFDAPDHSPEEEQAQEDRKNANDSLIVFKNLGMGFAIGAGVFATTSIILLVRDLKKRPSSETISLGPNNLIVRF